MNELLNIKNLRVNFIQDGSEQSCLRCVNLWVNPGETVGLVGESGCGKSVTAHAILRLLSNSAVEVSGEIWLEGEDLLKMQEREMLKVRGKKIGMVFQNPMTSLNPTRPIGSQIIEGILRHCKIARKEARSLAIDLLTKVGISDPEQRYNQYPYQFSGGMRQRVMIAIALACNPSLIIADEPTTALDVTIQAQILDLLKSIQKAQKTSILLITHDLGVVAGMCDRVFVMHSGEIVETGTVEDIFYRPRHPYTQSLIRAHPYFAQQAIGSANA